MFIREGSVLKLSIFIGLIASLIIGGIYLFLQPVDIPKDTEKNLEMRYNSDFEFNGYSDNGTLNSREMYFSSNEGNIYTVARYYDSNKTVQYNDNVLGFKFKKDLENKVLNIANILDYETVVFLDVEKSQYPDNTNSSYSLERFLSDSSTVLDFNIISSSIWSDSDIKKFTGLFYVSLGVKARFNILVSNSNITEDAFHHEFTENDRVRVAFSLGDGGSLGYVNRE